MRRTAIPFHPQETEKPCRETSKICLVLRRKFRLWPNRNREDEEFFAPRDYNLNPKEKGKIKSEYHFESLNTAPKLRLPARKPDIRSPKTRPPRFDRL